MTRRILRRVAVAMLLVPLVATVLFFLMHLAPGDPVFVLAGEDVRPEALDNLRRLYGLDRPLGEQYVRWLGNVLRWDWGQSIPTGRPTATILAEALPNSLLLGFVATVISFSVALLLALAAVYWRDGWIDHAIRIGSLIFYSTPAFWLALLAIWLFSYQLGWLPASGILSPGRSEVRGTADVLDMAWHLILPAGVLGLSGMAGTLRILRGELLEAMGRDYARTARAKGLSRARTLGVHALRNALVPAAQLLRTSASRPPQRRADHRGGLRLARPGEGGDGCDPHPRLPGGAGDHRAQQHPRHSRQPPRRPPTHGPRPTGA